ncbi:helix-turn-helix domain-containing protein [Nocardia yamanashiensis]|uniref:helix-turn-helix domain-containing protein n=1 Tax=Nocardia yamanashiensis TaxID=209247 RepID=UPI0008330C6C|nr:helix-turn-helix transcriptional regulator [Nocardia yamanashiensis]UGT41453.1 helix-turn-helix domain-containing protein [Nocardia yamanashiensis]
MLAAGTRIEISPQTLDRLENGQQTKITTPQISVLLDLYQVTDGERAEALELWDEIRRQAAVAKKEGTHKGWWQQYSDLFAPHLQHYLRLEDGADHMTTHQLVMVPGLLQAPEYRRAIIRANDPSLSPVGVERLLELAMRRKARLDDPGFRLEALLSEAVLHHQPGGPRVMSEQLGYLAEASAHERISIRVVPFTVGMHPGLVIQSFSLLEFPRLPRNLVDPPVVYREGADGALYLERDDVIQRCRAAIAGIQQVALSEEDTRELVSAMAKEYAA